ncbi:MAG: HNH endonuclease signature motif containing protein [Pirellulales bacterium]
MDAALRRFVRQRAAHRCEYCQLLQDHEPFVTFHTEHIIAKHHGGEDDPSNLCLACPSCNFHKGPNIAGRLAATSELIPLFNPRRDRWEEHFRWDGALLAGLTPVGLVTLQVLRINLPENVEHRDALIAEGVFPPPASV